MSLRIGGIAAIVGGTLLASGLLWGALDPADEDPGFVVGLLGSIALLVGMTGLSAFQARRHSALMWATFALPAVGGALATLGLILMTVVGDQPVAGVYGWGLLIIGMLATIVGSLLFAIATYRTAALPRPGAVILGISAVASLVSFIVGSGQGGSSAWIIVAAFGAFALGWVVLGLQAIHLDRPAVAVAPA